MRNRPPFIEIAQETARKQNEDGRHAPLIITGPSGVGKNTLIQGVGEFLYKYDIPLNITHSTARETTREFRPEDNINDKLTRVSEEEFLRKIKSEEFFYHYENLKGMQYGFDKKKLLSDLQKINPALYMVKGREILPFFSKLHHGREDLGALSPLVISVKARVSTITERLNKRPASEQEKRERQHQLETQYSSEIGAIESSTTFFRTSLEEVWTDDREDFELAIEIVVERTCDHINYWLTHNEPPVITREKP